MFLILLNADWDWEPIFMPDFLCCQKCVQNPKTKGMPLSSFLLKPMQRITKYPLMIQKVGQLGLYLPVIAPTYPLYFMIQISD